MSYLGAMTASAALTTDGETSQTATDDLRFTLGDRLRKARELRRIGVEEMADRLGYQRNMIRRWESGASTPRAVILKTWANETGVPFGWLVTGEVPPTPAPDGEPAPASRKTPAKARGGRRTPNKSNSWWNTAPAASRRGSPSRRSPARMGSSPKGPICRFAA